MRALSNFFSSANFLFSSSNRCFSSLALRKPASRSFRCFRSAAATRFAVRFIRMLETRGLKAKAVGLRDAEPHLFMSITRIEEAYVPECRADCVGGGSIGRRQNCVSSSITKGTNAPVSPRIKPGEGPSIIHRCPCNLARTCEKSIRALLGITQASA